MTELCARLGLISIFQLIYCILFTMPLGAILEDFYPFSYLLNTICYVICAYIVLCILLRAIILAAADSSVLPVRCCIARHKLSQCVRLSRSDVLSKRLNIWSKFFHWFGLVLSVWTWKKHSCPVVSLLAKRKVPVSSEPNWLSF